MRPKYLCASLAFSVVAFVGSSPGAGPSPSPTATPPHLVLQQAGAEESVTSVAFSPDSSLVATSADGRVRVLDARTGALLRAFGSDADRGGHAVAFAPDGRSLASSGYHMDKLARLYDARTGATLRTFAGHTEIETYAVAPSPDGRLLASSGTDKQILVWELATGKLLHRLAGQALPVTALAFSPDSATLATGGGEKTVRLWDSATGRPLRTFAGHRDWICTIAFSPDGKTIASGGCDWAYHRGRNPSRFEGRDPGARSEWKLWDATTGDLGRTVVEQGRLLSLAFAPDGKSLACGVANDVRLYDLRTENPGRIVTSHDGAITSVAFSPDGRALVSGSHDRTVRRVALPAGTVEWRLPGYWEQVNSVALSNDGSLIATGSSDLRFAERKLGTNAGKLGPGALRLWDARTGRLLRRLGEPNEQVMAVALSPDGRRAVGGGGVADGSGFVHVWDAATGAPVWSGRDHPDVVLAVAYAPDGSSLAVAGADGSIKLRDPGTGDVVRTLSGHDGGATSVAFAGDGSILAVGAADGVAHLWELRTGRQVRTFRPGGSLARAPTGGERVHTSVALSRDGGTLVTCTSSMASQFGDRVVRVWDARTGDLKREISTSQARGRFVTLSPDGTTLAGSGVGKSIALWDLRTGEQLRSLAGHAHPPQSAVFSADGRLLVSGGDYRTTKVWDVATGRLLATLVTFSESRPGTSSDDWLAYTPDGSYDGSPGVDRYLAWRVDDDLQTADSLGPQLHRPERLAAALKLPPPRSDLP